MKGDNKPPIILVTVCLCHSPQTSATSPANATPALSRLIKTPVSHLLESDHCIISSSTLASLPDCALPCDHSLALFLPLTLDLPDSPPYGAFPWAPYRPRFQASWVQAKMLCQQSRPLVGQGVTAHTTVHARDSFKEEKNKKTKQLSVFYLQWGRWGKWLTNQCCGQTTRSRRCCTWWC